MEQEMQDPQVDSPEDAGRGTDKVMAHMSLGEIVIPLPLQDGPNFEAIKQLFDQAGVDIGEFTVGSEANKINPETGYAEFGFFQKAFKFAQNPFNIIPKGIENIIQKIAPIALTVAGQPELAAAYSGANTVAHGGNLGQGLKSAGLTYGLSQLGSAATGGDSILNGTSAGDLLKGAGDYLGLGDLSSSIVGKAAGTPLSGGFSGPTLGSGVKGALTGGSSGISSALGGNASSYALPALGAANSLYANSQAQDQLKKATKQANASLQPYQQTGAAANTALQDYLGLGGAPASSDEILAASPGYRFQQEQGLQGIDRSAAAHGGLFSGAQGKALADYNSGLAKQASNDYYAKLANAAGTGLSASTTAGTNTTALGTAGAASNIATGNSISQLLAGVGRKIIGYDPTTRQPIYG